jgi:peptidoglycan/xylan/chitin deacetylase (PgdA/CDA1 family)
MGLLRQLTKTILTACVSRQRLLTYGPRAVHGALARIGLTFDDGPHPEHTPRLLDVLAERHLTATFFVIGELAMRHRELIRRIAAEGHELGNHTWSHGEPSRTDTKQFLDEIRKTDELLADLTGTAPRTMRPPKGELNWGKLSGVWQRGQCVALWNVDPRDYRMSSADDMAAWCSGYEPHDGDILLMHDNHPWAITAMGTLASRGVFDHFQTTNLSDWLRPTTKQRQAIQD